MYSALSRRDYIIVSEPIFSKHSMPGGSRLQWVNQDVCPQIFIVSSPEVIVAQNQRHKRLSPMYNWDEL